MFENPFYVVGAILLVIVLVWLILKSISILIKLVIVLAVSGILYFLYGYYPREVIAAGAIIIGCMVLIYLMKRMFKKKK